jgi:hypothetical protein
MWTERTGEPRCAGCPVDDGGGRSPRDRRLPGMSIEVVPGELYALAGVLQAAAGAADRTAAGVPGDPVSGAVGEAVQAFAETLRTAAHCLAGELRWLGTAVAGAADSWFGLDGSLLPRRDAAVPQ